MKLMVSFVVAALAVAIGTAQAAQQALRGIAIDETLDGPAILLAASPSAAARLPMLARLTINPATFRGDGSRAAFDRLDARLALYRDRSIPVIVVLGSFPVADADVDSWIETIRTIVEHGRARVRAYQVGAFTDAREPAIDRYAFLLKRAAVEIRAVDTGVLILHGSIPSASADWLTHLYADGGAAPYSDGVAIGTSRGAATRPSVLMRAIDPLVRAIDSHDANASIVLSTSPLAERGDDAARQLVDAAIGQMGTRVGVIATTTSSAALNAALTALARV